MNKPVVAAAVVGVAAGSAHFILPQPASADNVDINRRLIVGAVALMGSGLAASLFTGDKSYIALSVMLTALMFGGYKGAQYLDAKYV